MEDPARRVSARRLAVVVIPVFKLAHVPIL
jgi:hypothetical protein